MKTTQMIASILGVIILLMAVAVPLIANMEANTGSPVMTDNQAYEYKMAKATSLSSAITLEKTADGVTADGVATTAYVIVTDSIAVNVAATGTNWIHTNGDNPTTTGNLAWTTGDKLVFNGNTWNLTPAQGSETVAASGTFSWIYFPSDSGKYIKANTESTGAVKVDRGAVVVTVGFLSTTKQCVTTGTIASLSVLYGNANTAGNAIVIDAEKDGYTYDLTSVTVGTATHSQQVIVPLQYTSDIAPTITTTLVGIMPVLLIAALVIGIGYRIIASRMED